MTLALNRRKVIIWTNVGPVYYRLSVSITHWGRVTHICVSKLTNIGSDNGLSSCRRQTIIWTNAGMSFIGPLGTNFSEILIEIRTFSFKKMHLKMSSGKWRPFCLGLNVLTPPVDVMGSIAISVTLVGRNGNAYLTTGAWCTAAKNK